MSLSEVNEKVDIDLLKKNLNIVYNGPGIWYCIHSKAAYVKNYNNMLDTIKDIKFYIKTLKCENCKQHAIEYEKIHPLNDCLQCKHQNHKGGIEMCLFKWTCDFHNAVNSRINKPIIGYELAYDFYSDKLYIPCDNGCDKDIIQENVKPNNSQVYFTKSIPFKFRSS